MKRITEEQEAYIKAHINDRPRVDVARKAGISVNTLYVYVRLFGGEKRYELSTRDAEWERIVRENYPFMSGHEIERKFNITRNRANKIAHSLGLKHNDETIARLKRERVESATRARNASSEAKRKAKWKARRRLDEMRVWEGKPQKTRFRFRVMSQKAYKAKWCLCNKRGYIESTDPYILLYDKHTKRTVSNMRYCGTEKFYEEKYKLKFLPL